MRAGIGFDAHRFSRGRPLVLGGLRIPYPAGLEGWSDGDVLIHAVADALLGALAAGDIGQHFPPGDPRFKDISSLTLLEQVVKMLDDKGYQVVNVDTMLILEAPKIESYRDKMSEVIAKALKVDKNQVSIKATTTEQLGFTGRGEGVAAQAIALIKRKIER